MLESAGGAGGLAYTNLHTSKGDPRQTKIRADRKT